MYSKRDILSIPNILGYFRILLIPVFMYIYLTAESDTEYYVAAGIVALSMLTDFFDGQIARRFNQITELGKLVDPVADKLTQAGLVISVAVKYDNAYMWALFVLLAVKEIYMGTMSLLIIKYNGNRMDGAKWYGKVCTAALFIIMIVLFLGPVLRLSDAVINILIAVCAAFLLFALVMYTRVFVKLYRGEKV